MDKRNVGLVGVLLLGILILVVGCTGGNGGGNSISPLRSKNLQYASLNATGQIATAVLLDNTDLASLDATILTLSGCLADAKSTVNGEVTFVNLGPVLVAKFPAGKYRAYVSQILILVEGQTLPTERIGEANVRRISEFLNGAVYRASNYDATARDKKAGEVKSRQVGFEVDIHPDFYKSSTK